MGFQILVAFFTFPILFLIIGGEPAKTQGRTTHGGGSTNLINLGQVDGKFYLTDDQNRTWFESDAYCKSLGMDFATITSQAQVDFLKSVYDVNTFEGWYWIAARDAHSTTQFLWNEDLEAVSPFNRLGLMNSLGSNYQTCLCYSSNDEANGYLWIRECWRVQYTLCELKG